MTVTEQVDRPGHGWTFWDDAIEEWVARDQLPEFCKTIPFISIEVMPRHLLSSIYYQRYGSTKRGGAVRSLKGGQRQTRGRAVYIHDRLMR